MSKPFEPSDPEALARARAHAERPLTLEEFNAALASELSPEERAEKQALINWFTRRYPTPAERLAYGRRYARSVRRMLEAVKQG